MRHWIVLLALLALPALSRNLTGASPDPISAKILPVPGEVFSVEGHAAFLCPAPVNSAAKGRPWVWYAPTLPGLPGNEERWMFDRFLASGIGVAGIDVGESYGSPNGRKLFTAFHAEMVKRGYSTKPVLLGRSRGGLMTLSWAAENPDKVGGFAGVYPVCNVASYPGIAKAAPAYGMSADELQAHLQEHNPIDRLAGLAKAHVPLFAIHGDVDKLVPLNENSGVIRDRYAALGGSMRLIVPPGQGHNMWTGFFQCEELVEFVQKTAGPNITLTSPRDYEVIQRQTRKRGRLKIEGRFAGMDPGNVKIEGRLVVDGKPTEWRSIRMDARKGTFRAQWTAPAGGWHSLEVRAVSGPNCLKDSRVEQESRVEHVGIGEVFVVAGQSNSANHGAEKQSTQTGLVAAFDGKRWQIANDPQPGASGSGGSFMPPFGDAMARDFHVPIGIVACGVGATSVREWLPKDSKFPNPPTLTNHVQQLANGTWASKGDIFANFASRLRQLGPNGFRAVLWHQGESDANQADSTRTLAGPLYHDYLAKLIRDTGREIGWKAPWFVAQASYHVPGDEGSLEIRNAQSALWKENSALAGPDTDALKGELRDEGGKGVHFSGTGLREHAARWHEKVAPWLQKQLR